MEVILTIPSEGHSYLRAMGHDIARKDEMKGITRPLRASEGTISMLLSIGTPSPSAGKAREDGEDA